MSADSLSLLYDECNDMVATARMRRKRVPCIRLEYDLENGIHTLTAVVNGEVVATGSATALDRAARKCWEAFTGWHADTSDVITHALKVSIECAQGGAK